MTDGLRIVRGRPTDEELAALVAVLLARPSGPAKPPAVSRWARSARPAQRLGTRGPDAWRASALPGLHGGQQRDPR